MPEDTAGLLIYMRQIALYALASLGQVFCYSEVFQQVDTLTEGMHKGSGSPEEPLQSPWRVVEGSLENVGAEF